MNELEAAPPSSAPWWSVYRIEPHHGGCWQIGPSTLWLFHAPNEWRLIHRELVHGTQEERSEARVPIPEEEWADVLDPALSEEQTIRFGFRHDDARVALQPALADRPVVARPEHPIHIPVGEDVTLYVSTPLWIRLELGPAGQCVHEIPSHRPSDTWFGPSTREGELCYATRTTGRTQLDDVPLRPHRAVTPLLIQNRASDALLLERVQIPTQHLSLYASADHMLWTQTLTLRREEGLGAGVRIEPGAPRVVATAKQITEPRQVLRNNLVMSTFKALGAFFSS